LKIAEWASIEDQAMVAEVGRLEFSVSRSSIFGNEHGRPRSRGVRDLVTRIKNRDFD
jgi:hypothetical protein